jgi:hypothetical protein
VPTPNGVAHRLAVILDPAVQAGIVVGTLPGVAILPVGDDHIGMVETTLAVPIVPPPMFRLSISPQ